MQNEQTNHMIDSIIIDCNDAVKLMISGNYIAWCNSMVKIVQKLADLKKCIHDDIQNRDEQTNREAKK